MTVTVLGLDLSLTSSGCALAAPDMTATTRLRPPNGATGHRRLEWLLDDIAGRSGTVTLVVIEGPSYGNQGQGRQAGHHERAGLWWLVTHQLWTLRIPYAVAPPAAVKRYATGKGNAGKDDVLREVTKRFPWFSGGNDEADALVLAAMGADHLGHPLAPMPVTHRAALAGVTWPTEGEAQ